MIGAELVDLSPLEDSPVGLMILGVAVVPHREDTHQRHRVVSLGQLILNMVNMPPKDSTIFYLYSVGDWTC